MRISGISALEAVCARNPHLRAAAHSGSGDRDRILHDVAVNRGAIEITPKVSGQTNNNLVKEVFQSRPIKAALTRVTVRPMEAQSDVESKPLVWFEAQVVPTCRVVQAELCSMITRYATQTVTEITPMSIAIPRTNELAR